MRPPESDVRGALGHSSNGPSRLFASAHRQHSNSADRPAGVHDVATRPPTAAHRFECLRLADERRAALHIGVCRMKDESTLIICGEKAAAVERSYRLRRARVEQVSLG